VSVAIEGTTVKLSTVTYKPTGDGPNPTLIYHHGADSFEPPYEYKAVANWFVAPKPGQPNSPIGRWTTSRL
jgi:hypothetical protein